MVGRERCKDTLSRLVGFGLFVCVLVFVMLFFVVVFVVVLLGCFLLLFQG